MSFILEQIASSAVKPHFEWLLATSLEPGVTDVLANGPSEWWTDRGQGLEQHSAPPMDAGVFNQLCRFLIALGGRHLDHLSPITDVTIGLKQLPVLASGGVARLRIHCALDSTITEATLLTIRVHRLEAPTLGQLELSGMITRPQLHAIHKLLRDRANFIIIGPTGSGKTTLLRAMLAASPELRTIAVEDTAELLPISGHAVGLQVRQSNIEGVGEIPLDVLASQALRMRPDRLIIGEVRGVEALVLLRAMTTGHAGSAATMHADSVGGLRLRLATLVAGQGIEADTVNRLIDTSVTFVLELAGGKTRCLNAIHALGNSARSDNQDTEIGTVTSC